MGTRYQIKLRCLSLGITQRSLMSMVIEKTGEKLDPATWSSYVNCYIVAPKAERCLKAADEILSEMEAKK